MIGKNHLKLLAIPSLLILLAFFFYPLLKLFLLSLQAPSWTLIQYKLFFSTPAYVEIATRTIFLSAFVVLICIAVGYPAAAFINASSPSARKYLLACVVVPYMTSILVRTYAWLVILSDNGLINNLLIATRITERPIPLVYNRFGVVLAMVHIMLPIMGLSIYSVMRGMDPALRRASISLGAGPLRTFTKVILPQTLPGIRGGSILVFVISLGFYITPAALGGLGDVMISTLIESEVNASVNFPFAAAMGFLLLTVTLGIYFAVSGIGTELSPKSSSVKNGNGLLNSILKGLAAPDLTTKLSGFFFERRMGRADLSVQFGSMAVGLIGVVILAFLVLPSIIVVIVSFNAEEFLAFPPNKWSLRWYESYLTSRSWIEPTWVSFKIAILSTIISVLLGIPAAYALVRTGGRAGRFVYALILAPMVVPAVVVGVAMYGVFASWKLLGTNIGVLLAHTCGALTYVVTITVGVLSGMDPRLELASLSLGASVWKTFRAIIAPLIKPGIVAGGLFAFIYSLDEVVITSFVAGTRLQTLPLKMWEDIRHQVDPTIAAVSALLIVLTLLCLPFIREHRS